MPPDTERAARIAAFGADRSGGAQPELLDLFVRRFYGGVLPEDLDGREDPDLYFAAAGLFGFMRERAPGTDKVRVYTPDAAADGWTSPHTVIDLVTDDRPFIVDSVSAELNRRGLPIRFLAHPTWLADRDETGRLRALRAPGTEGAGESVAESAMRIEIGRRAGADNDELAARLAHILEDVRNAVGDWRAMRRAIEDAIGEVPAGHDEIVAFLRWLTAHNFTFVGYRLYDLEAGGGAAFLKGVPGTALGIMRRAEERDNRAAARGRPLPPEVLDRLRGAGPLIVSKSARRSTVHRPVHMDSIEVKRRSADGEVVGVHRFLGLYTSHARRRPPAEVPGLRRKVERVLARAGLSPESHDGKSLQHVIETFPRDELFQYADDALVETALGILRLRDRPRPRVFVREDSFGWTVSCLVFVPRDRWSAGLRGTVARILETAFSGDCEDFFTWLDDDPLARLHVIVRTAPGEIPAWRAEAIEAQLVAALRGWDDDLRDALRAAHNEGRAAALERRYGAAFPPGYRHRFTAREAVDDIERVEAARGGGLALDLYRPSDRAEGLVRFRIYRRGEQLALSDMLPTLENMGLHVTDEFPYRLTGVDDGGDVWIHDLGIRDRAGAGIDIAAAGARFREAFARTMSGEAEDDGFNRLIVRAGLDWRETTVLRAYAKYLVQARIAFSQAYMEQTLAANPGIARRLVDLFMVRLDPTRRPEGERKRAGEEIAAEIRKTLDSVESLDEDRIVRRFLNAVESTLRTNFFQRTEGGEPLDRLALKIDSTRIDDLPAPRPMVEIFVYAARVEGVHLRGGKVARGGVRWSHRREDFRTEILGLMKAQMVKNAVIVPVGAKGGFVVKRPPANDEDARAEGVACYRTFISGLLDVTDNPVAGEVAPPRDTVCYDGDDPYLVVAADKGTAAFSDIANGIAEEYGFWLGDAFASGGSSGYDHKRMGITARGAWEAVKRHFRDMGEDPRRTPFTVVGIGDMSGDVFGNGMLLSRHIRLVGAFNHRHIFIDPDPDAKVSFAERQRLFGLKQSSWTDYNPASISTGGGVFDRGAKSIAIAPEIRRRFGIDAESLTPNRLISALLRAPVDLLWNGGIGTYVKAGDETDAEVDDRANDAVRIDAAELRCKVVGEGGNLGLTQRARIEAARRGVRINSDAIDNSAGVDCSDREVNIKVLLRGVEDDGALTRDERDSLLAAMTDDVAERCLADNYRQALGIGVIESLGAARLDWQQRTIQALERSGRLDRAVEALPDDEAIDALRTAGQGLTRPEISAIYAHAKNALYDELLTSDLPDDPFLAEDLESYFPDALAARYAPFIRRHRLRREIVATQLANSMVDRASMVFALMAGEETGRGASDVARAYAVTRAAFGLRDRWAAIEALDDAVPSAVQNEMIVALRGLMEHSVLWLLRNRPQPLDCRATADLFGSGVAALGGGLDGILPDDLRAAMADRAAALTEKGVPGPLAGAVAAADPLYSACGIVEAANRTGAGVLETGRLFFDIGRRLGIDWLRDRARRMATASYWERQAASAIADDLYGQQAALTVRAIGSGGSVEDWIAENRAIVSRNARLLDDLRGQPAFDLSMLTFANRQMRDLVRG